MTKDCSDRKHTPIVSQAQRGFFGAELARKRAGKETKTGMSEEELARHLRETKGKKLAKRKHKRNKNASYSKEAVEKARSMV